VKNEIQKLQEQEERSSAEGEEVNFITFDQLIDPTKNRAIVAAQALSHTLLLATKGLVYVSQEEAFGTIQISVV
jgi:chromatin segregation and condensation protein Rec8/ScpA/Scc1 (kleisin family)